MVPPPLHSAALRGACAGLPQQQPKVVADEHRQPPMTADNRRLLMVIKDGRGIACRASHSTLGRGAEIRIELLLSAVAGCCLAAAASGQPQASLRHDTFGVWRVSPGGADPR